MAIEQLGPYQIRRKIGRGGMGTVFEGVNVSTGQAVAVKLLSADMAHQPGFRERFEIEIETLRKLNHPNVVRIIGFGEQDEHLFYSMEFIPGSSLEEQLNRGRRFDWREVMQFGIETCHALRHAHDRGVIHRDIKPGNLLLTDEGHIKLSDFGIARLYGNLGITGAGNVLGTGEYMSPEQADGRPIDPRTDLYSLGGVMYVLLARRPLFLCKTFPELLEKQRTARPEALRLLAPEIPIELEQIIHQLLEKDPDRRFPNAMLLGRRLEAMGQRLSIDTCQEDESDELEINSTAPVPDEFAPTRVATNPGGLPLGVALEPVFAGPSPSDLPETRLATVDAPAESPAEPLPPAKTVGRFVHVTPGELDIPVTVEQHSTWISPQTWVLIICLLAVGLMAWFLLQPQTADSLYRRISAQTEGGDIASLRSAEDDIRQFVARFPHDSRCKDLQDSIWELDLDALETRLNLHAKGFASAGNLLPIERTYLDALNHARLDPETGRDKFRAMVDLYSIEKNHRGPTWQCLELAQRRLKILQEQCETQTREQVAEITERLNQADKLAKSDAAKAKAVYQAVIDLYQGKPWAADLVRRARKGAGM